MITEKGMSIPSTDSNILITINFHRGIWLVGCLFSFSFCVCLPAGHKQYFVLDLAKHFTRTSLCHC